MSAETLRRAAEQARQEAATELSIAPSLERMYGDDNGTKLDARRHAAVGTWLDSHADIHALRACDERLIQPCPALAVARAYLGDDQ